ncbi:sulfur carrier protein [Clostridium sp. USBA 49]|uniref:sulfur carrier protein ThiS n=1 Tax=Clostridium TaxID=1485 RepID=UPI00099AF7EA|nr:MULTISPECIES: sulfur carrier protein ThiS [Clostridium]SKA74004.1 sulfur carrier protein [Clostridium sp. USBA 49]
MIVNGKEMNFKDSITVKELLENLNIHSDRVVVEVDMDIIPKDEYSQKKLYSYSKVEIIRFVGGG